MGSALITGATSGLGLEFAWQLATAKQDVILVARDKRRLEDVAQRIRSAAGVRVETIAADLAQRHQLDPILERLHQEKHPVGLLVNNAGFGTGGPFIAGDLERHEEGLEVMVRSLMVLSHAAANSMISRGRGAIINVSSVASYLAGGTYSADKAWVARFTEGLAVELMGTGVKAMALLPGLTRTEFHSRAQIKIEGLPQFAWLNADQVVRQALYDVKHGVVLCTPSVRYTVLGQIARFAPRWIIRLFNRKRLY